MKREFGLDQVVRDEASVVTVGTFDGVHRGHQAILSYLIERAQIRSGQSVVVTFDPHPREVLRGELVPLLTTIGERALFLEAHGVDRLIVLPFTREFSQLPPEAFVTDYLVERIGLREIVIGYDHHFGRGREGDSMLLETLGTEHGFNVDIIPPQVIKRSVVSSTRIRNVLQEDGDVTLAAEMLGRLYSWTGDVVRGNGRGRTIGFPTANLVPAEPRKVIPKRGVYAVYVADEAIHRTFGGMMNIGVRPTFDGTAEQLEVHLFDIDEDLYGRRLRIDFVERMRDERRFPSVAALIEQLSEDRKRCKRALEAVS